MATTRRPLGYLPVELQSYLPSGWSIVEGDPGARDERRGVWSIRLRDGADTEWRLEVSAADAGRHGRLEALRQAVDRLYREALG